MVLVLLLIFDLSFAFQEGLVVLDFNTVSSLLKKLDHFLAIEHKVDPGDVDALHFELLLNILFEENTSRKSIGISQLLLVHHFKLLPMSSPHINLNVVVRGCQVEFIIGFAESLGVLLVVDKECKS